MAERHLWGAGATACSVCCASPLLAAAGIVGGAAMLATMVFAGVVFAVVVGLVTLAVAWQRRSRARAAACTLPPDSAGPVEVELLPFHPQDRVEDPVEFRVEDRAQGRP